MPGLLIFLITAALLVVALAPAHRRATTPFRPGADLRADRDRQRLGDELAAVSPR